MPIPHSLKKIKRTIKKHYLTKKKSHTKKKTVKRLKHRANLLFNYTRPITKFSLTNNSSDLFRVPPVMNYQPNVRHNSRGNTSNEWGENQSLNRYIGDNNMLEGDFESPHISLSPKVPHISLSSSSSSKHLKRKRRRY